MQDSTEQNESRTITDRDIAGLKYFDQLGQLLQQRHHVGCERDKAGNRSLHTDQYCILMLLYMFNPERLKPIIESLGEKLIPNAAVYALRSGSRRSHKNGGNANCRWRTRRTRRDGAHDRIQTIKTSFVNSGNCWDAVICCMLISLRTGRKTTPRTHEMICWYFCGTASEERLLVQLARLQKPSWPRKTTI